MEARDRGIAVQVAFKGAIDLAVKADLDLTSDDGRTIFETVFSHLTESLLTSLTIVQSDSQKMADVIKGEFPGSQWESGDSQPQAASVRVKGEQHGPLPAWLFEQAAAKGVTEVWDNRDKIAGTNRPHFKSTSGGDSAPAFWPPRSR